MLSVPYLILFFVSLGMQIAFYAKLSDKMRIAGHIVGATCGLYITFMIWLYAGFGESSHHSVLVTINGKPMYSGMWSILPVIIFALILTPLLSWSPRWIAYILTHFIKVGASMILPKTELFTGFARGFCIFAIIFSYFCIGFLPLFLMLDEAEYSTNFIAYLKDEFIHFSFCGLLLAIWFLVGIRYLANIIVSKFNENKKIT